MADAVKPMTEEELLTCLKKYCPDLSMTIEDLRMPKPPFIMSVFRNFLQSLQVNVDFIYTPPFAVSETLENIEWYEEVLSLCTLKILVSHMMQFSGITDLSIKDILEPKPKRTKKILNYLVALWTYVLIKGSMYDQVMDKYQEEIDRKQELANEIALTEKLINEKMSVIKKKKELLGAYKENKAKFDLQAKSKDVSHENYQKLKGKQANYLKKLRDLDVQRETQKVKLEELDQKIMKSPDRFDSEKERLRQKILEFENKTKEIQLKSTKQKKLNSTLADNREILLKMSETMKAFSSVGEELHELAGSLDLDVRQYKEEEENVKRLQIELEKEEEHKYLNEQWLGKENLNAKKRVDAIKEIMVMDKEAIGKAESDCKRKQTTVVQLQEQIKSAKQVLNGEKERHEIFAKKCTQEYDLLKTSFVDYFADTKKAFEEAVEKNVDPKVLAKIKKALGLK